MVKMTRVSGTLVAAALAAALTGCSPAPTPSPTSSATETPSPTPTTLPPAEQDLANAKSAVVKLWAVVDRLTNDPAASLQPLDEVASGTALEFFRKNLTGYRLEQLTGSGSQVVEPRSAELAGKNGDGLTTWTVMACVDASQTKLVDTSGKNVTAPPYRILHRSVVVQRSAALFVDQDDVLGTF